MGGRISNEAFVRNVRSQLAEAYRNMRPVSPILAQVMRVGVGAEARAEIFGAESSPPRLARWERGDSIARATQELVTWEVDTTDFGVALDYHADDLEDADRLFGYGQGWAEKLAARARQLPEEILLQIMDATADPRLLATIPTAADGVAMFSATDSDGGARFGVASMFGGAGSGNILTGQGYATTQAVKSDVLRASAMVESQEDTRGGQLHSQGVADRKVVIASTQHAEVFKAAFGQRTLSTPAGGSESNLFLDLGEGVTLWLTSAKSPLSTVVVFPDAGGAALEERIMGPPTTVSADQSNSDRARDTMVHAIYCRYRAKYALGFPHGVVKINNV